MFEDKINDPAACHSPHRGCLWPMLFEAVKAFFESLDLDVWDAWSFFKLLDSDGGGMVEIVDSVT